MWAPTHFVFLLLVPLPVVLSVPFKENYRLSIEQVVADAAQNAVDPNLYQLPKNLNPTRYNLTVIPYLIEGNFTFHGVVQIDFTAVQDTSILILNSKNLTIGSVNLTGSGGTLPINSNFTLDDIYQRLTITPQITFQANQSYQVTIIYTGLLQDDMLGFYRSSYKIGSEKKWMAVTQFESTYARRAFPCFDEPAFRAKFTVNLGRFEYQNSISNMELKSTSGKHAEFEDRVIDTYEESPHMPTYLVAFCVGELVSVTSSDQKFKIWMREDAVEQAQYLIRVGETVLKTIGNYVNVTYALPKMDVVAVPDFDAGAMENWGLTTFREKYVLYDKQVSSVRDKQALLAVVAHEFGHQWFGDLVTPLWWNYTWLNEAFATYFEYNAPDEIEPTWKMLELFILDNVQYALASDSGKNPRPITAQVYTPSEISGIFDYVIYEKGGSVLRMAEHFLTRNVFKTGLNYYLTSSRTSGIGTPENLFSALDKAAAEAHVLTTAGFTVADVLGTWTTQGGYPLLTVNRTENSTALSQKRYTVADNTTSPSSWYIPLTYTVQSAADFQDTSTKDWLKPGESKSISIQGDGWVVFNIQQTGFYRVNYDDANWGMLADQLHRNASLIDVNNRAQLMDDAFNLAADGHISFYTAFNLSQYLSQEREYVPWYSAMSNLRFLIRRYQGTEMGNNLQRYASSLVLPYYQYLMSNVSDAEPHLTTLGRISAVQWACDLGVYECETYASNAFNDWINNGVLIGQNVKAGVLCTGLRLGGDTEWDAVWNLYLQSNSYSEKITILYALGCTESENSIDKFLSTLATNQSDVRAQDKYLVYRAIARRQAGIGPAIRFIVNNYNALIQYSGNDTVASIISTIGAYVMQDEHYNQVQAVASNQTLPYDLRSRFNLTLTSATYRREWVAKYQDSIQVWVNEVYGASHGTHLIPTVTNTVLGLLVVVFVCMELF